MLLLMGVLLHIMLMKIVCASVTVLYSFQFIYESSPKLRIQGTGFHGQNPRDIHLKLGDLIQDKDYLLTMDINGEFLLLKLLQNRVWAKLSLENPPPVALNLSSVTFTSSGQTNLLVNPVMVARVLATPSIPQVPTINILNISKSMTNELIINGTGFIGAPKMVCYFSPPLIKYVTYEDTSSYPLQNNFIRLHLRHGYSWRVEPGPLNVIGIDSGGGPVSFREGVLIAYVQEDPNSRVVRVNFTADSQLLYANDDTVLNIYGSNFSPSQNTIRFSNGILGNGINYTINVQSNTVLSLKLTPGSLWRSNYDNLPGTLKVLAINQGQGFVAVGSSMTGSSGVDVATIFEKPDVNPSSVQIHCSQSHELIIHGTGFPTNNKKFRPQLIFSPLIEEGIDYEIEVMDRKTLRIVLIDGRAWKNESGSLNVTSINTRGDLRGWVSLENKQVAEVIPDVDLWTPEPTINPTTSSSEFTVLPRDNSSYVRIRSSSKLNYISIQFNVSMKSGESICSDVVPNHNFMYLDGVMIYLAANFEASTSLPADLQVYFPGTSYVFGGNVANGRIIIGNWPSFPSLLDKCYSAFEFVSLPRKVKFSQICLTNANSKVNEKYQIERFVGQIKLGAVGDSSTSILPADAIETWEQPFPTIPCTEEHHTIPTIAPTTNTDDDYYGTAPPTISFIRKDIYFASSKEQIIVQFDSMLQYGDHVCTEVFPRAIESDYFLPDLSFFYQVYSLDDENHYDAGLLEVYFPGNNLFFFATIHDGKCYSYQALVGFPLNFTQICIMKTCQHNPCPLQSLERYRGKIILQGYQTSSLGMNFQPMQLNCHIPQLDDDNPYSWMHLLPWIIGGCLLVMIGIGCGMFYMKQYYFRYHLYENSSFSSRNPIPVMMEMVSPLYRRSRRNQRLGATFSIPSSIVIEEPAQGIPIAGTAYHPSSRPPTKSLDNPAEYQRLTTADEEEEEEEGEMEEVKDRTEQQRTDERV